MTRPLPEGIVTFVFTDIEASTKMFYRLGDRYVDLLDRHNELLRGVWADFGGAEVKTEGDSFFVAFGNADEAIAACACGQQGMLAEQWPEDGIVRVRMGVHSGLAYPRGRDYVAFAVHQAARIVSAAHGGQIVVSEQTAALVGPVTSATLEPVGRYRLRDFDKPVLLFQVSGDGLDAKFPALRALPAEGHNLVRPVTSFVGRQLDVLGVDQLIGPGRLVTVVGPGGVGKTRLVIEIGLGVARQWTDGAWFVDLSPIEDPELITGAIAGAVGCSITAEADPWYALVEYLHEKRALVILDNCEHLIKDTSRLVTALLEHCRELGLLVTSREPLGVDGEQIWRVVPLDTTGDGATAAVQLFVERARSVRPSFQPDESAGTVRAICARLDGLPLAIELAAARVAVLTLEDILTGLEDRFRLLKTRHRSVPDRQRTLGALLDWSHRLLTYDEQKALRRLGLFAAGFDLNTAAAALTDDALEGYDVPELVWSLADKSLITVEPAANATRYRLPDSIRAYALNHLAVADEVTVTAKQLADWYLERLGPSVPGSNALTSLRAVEIDNLRGLIAILAQIDEVRAQRLASSVARLHRAVFAAAVGQAETRRFVSLLTHAGPERVALLCDLCILLTNTGDLVEARRVADDAAALRTVVGAPSWDQACVDYNLAGLAWHSGDYRRSYEIAQRALAAELDERSRAKMLTVLSLATLRLGDLDTAYDAEQKSLAVDLRSGRDDDVAVHYGNLAEIDFRRNAFEAAARHQHAALLVAAQFGSRVAIAFSMIMAARLEGRHSTSTTSVRLHAYAERILAENGFVLNVEDRRASDRLLTDARNGLGEARYTAERRASEHLSLPEAINLTETALTAVTSTSNR